MPASESHWGTRVAGHQSQFYVLCGQRAQLKPERYGDPLVGTAVLAWLQVHLLGRLRSEIGLEIREKVLPIATYTRSGGVRVGTWRLLARDALLRGRDLHVVVAHSTGVQCCSSCSHRTDVAPAASAALPASAPPRTLGPPDKRAPHLGRDPDAELCMYSWIAKSQNKASGPAPP